MASLGGKTILSSLLLAVQLCLGFWQICKLTPMGALIQGFVSRFLLLRFGRSPAYDQLKMLSYVEEGSLPLGLRKLFKRATCYETVVVRGNRTELFVAGECKTEIKLQYLGVDYVVERGGENMLFVNGVLSYYITENIWRSLSHQLEKITYWDGEPVFIKGYRQIFPPLGATGGVMSLPEVFDNLILENHIINRLDKWGLLPVNLSVSEEKLLKGLNLVGLLLQAKGVHWVYPTLFSLSTAAIREFNTWLRVALYRNINVLFCRMMGPVCDKLPLQIRIYVYSAGSFVENLKPSNDIEWKVVRGDICVVLGAAAKTHSIQGLVACADLDMSNCEDKEIVSYHETFSHPDEHKIEIEVEFCPSQNTCKCNYAPSRPSGPMRPSCRVVGCSGMSEFVRIKTLF